jgi:protein-L-isoaspartate(D-aspartate) O-methyltransferase
VLHVGSGLGYYSALMSHVAGEHGRVVAVEVDAALAAAAERNLAAYAGVEVRRGDACAPFDDTFDAILVSAGVTHPQPAWLDALRVEGRLIVPLTVSMPAMGRIGKGVVVCLTRTAAEAFTARTLAMTAIYSGIGLRDDEANAELGHTFARCPMPRLTRFRRDVHTASATCWLHNSHGCFELSETG